MYPIQETAEADSAVRPQVLLMEDEPSVAQGLQMILTEEGCRVDLAMTGKSALDNLDRGDFDLLVADLRLPDIDGMTVVKSVKANRPQTEVIIITGYSTVPSAVEAMKLGVYDYLPKPFTEDEFKAAVAGALKSKEAAPLSERFESPDTPEERLIQKHEVERVLNRATLDDAFWNDLMEKGSTALAGYRLSGAAKAAIVSGDLNWLKRQVGELTPEQLRFIYSRLEREAW
jgi:DNA-binding response OmpR family regulator